MSVITEESIQQCALTLGQFDSESVNNLVTLFHHQDACSILTSSSNNLKKQFENLLTTGRDNDENCNDTPLTRTELAIMLHFKEKYLTQLTNDNNQLKSDRKLSIENELDIAYSYLLAQIDDRLSQKHLDHLKFLLNVQASVYNLLDIYQKLGENFSNFFSLLIQCGYFARELVIADDIIRNFQVFIKRYEDFIITFAKDYKSLSYNTNDYTQPDNVSNKNGPRQKSALTTKVSSANVEQTSAVVAKQRSDMPVTCSMTRQSVSSSNVPQKALCVIINIKQFTSSQSFNTPKREGSDKDVEVIEIVFNKLKFTVLKCERDFTKDLLDEAFNHIDDKSEYGNFDCLVMFIMSHGLLHSFFTADSKEVIIRDIVKRYSDSSTSTIWAGKPRLFFIQACRSAWPDHIPCHNREGVKQSDLSPRMLVAYSCSASEASKRSPTNGSIFIQILCIMLLRYGHFYDIQGILEWTAKFVIKRDECVESKNKPVSIQRPEFIERGFSSNFRFSNYCLYDQYRTWDSKKQLTLQIPLATWQLIYDVKPTLDNLQRIAHRLAKRALENGYDPNFYSPFARSAKRSLGINICGGKPDDVTVLLAVVKSTCL